MTLNDIKNKRVYISGKMTGLPIEEIFKNFNSVEDTLVDNGNAVINPAVLWHLKDTTPFSAQDYLNIDFAMMEVCDTIIVLPNWETSSGAKKEISFAYCIDLEGYFLKENGELEKINYENFRD